MKTSKKIIINILSIVLLMLIYYLLRPLRLAALYVLNPIIVMLLNIAVEILFYIAFSYVFILAFEKNKCILSKPLFDSTIPAAQRYSVKKAISVCAIMLLFAVGSKLIILPVSLLAIFPISENVHVLIYYAILTASKLLICLIIYRIITNGGHRLCGNNKYTKLSLIIIITAAIILMITSTYGQIYTKSQSAFMPDNYMDKYMNAMPILWNFVTTMELAEKSMEIVIISALIACHMASVPSAENKVR